MGSGIKPGESSCHGLYLQLLILQELLVYCCDFQLTTSGWLNMLGYFYYLIRIEVYIEVLEKRQGLKVACLEGIAYRQGWIDSDTLRENAQPMLKNDYGKYLLSILEEKNQTLKKNLEY